MTNSSPQGNPEDVAEALPVDSAAIPTEPRPAEGRSPAAEMLALHIQGRRGANWFYWVAGLSMVNSAIIFLGGSIYFLVGLGVTMVGDTLATLVSQDHPNAAWAIKGIALTFDIFVALMLVAFGWLAGRRYLAAFILGMILYLLDGFIWIVANDWLCVAFHAYALFWMWNGFQAFRKLRILETTIQESGEAGPEPLPAT